MSRVKVVAFAHMPARLPISFTVLVWLLLDRLRPSAAWVGAVWTFVAIAWVVWLFAVFTQETCEPMWQEK